MSPLRRTYINCIFLHLYLLFYYRRSLQLVCIVVLVILYGNGIISIFSPVSFHTVILIDVSFLETTFCGTQNMYNCSRFFKMLSLMCIRIATTTFLGHVTLGPGWVT